MARKLLLTNAKLLTPAWLVESASHRLEWFKLDWPLSNRNIGRGHGFRSTHNERQRLETLVDQIALPSGAPYRDVVLVVCRVLGPREKLWDPDSVGRGNAKELIDAMAACGWIEDDGPKHVRHVAYLQHNQRPRPLRNSTIVQVWEGCGYTEVLI